MANADETKNALLDAIQVLAQRASEDNGSLSSKENAEAAMALGEAYSWVRANSSRTA